MRVINIVPGDAIVDYWNYEKFCEGYDIDMVEKTRVIKCKSKYMGSHLQLPPSQGWVTTKGDILYEGDIFLIDHKNGILPRIELYARAGYKKPYICMVRGKVKKHKRIKLEL